jgi:hypothetical protein
VAIGGETLPAKVAKSTRTAPKPEASAALRLRIEVTKQRGEIAHAVFEKKQQLSRGRTDVAENVTERLRRGRNTSRVAVLTNSAR